MKKHQQTDQTLSGCMSLPILSDRAFGTKIEHFSATTAKDGEIRAKYYQNCRKSIKNSPLLLVPTVDHYRVECKVDLIIYLSESQ